MAKTDSLAGKLIDGARALDEYFNTLVNHYSTDPKKFAQELSERYRLTESQQRYFTDIAQQVHNAKRIVGHLKRKFGYSMYRGFKDKEGLFRAVFDEEPPSELEAKAYTFAVGFNLPKKHFSNEDDSSGDYLGFAYNSDESYNLFDNLIIRDIRNKSVDYKGIRNICFGVNKEEIVKNAAPSRFLAAIFSQKYINISVPITKRHELKHIIDRFMGGNPRALIELSAELYADENAEIVLSEKYEQEDLEYMDAWREKMQLRKDKEKSSFLKYSWDKQIKKHEKRIKAYKDISLEPIQKVSDLGLDNATISFIISMTDMTKLEKRFRTLAKYLRQIRVVPPQYEEMYT